MNKKVKEKNFTLKQIILGKLSDFEPKIRDVIKLIKIQYYLFILSIVIICIGFFHYYYIKRIQYSKNWSFTQFILGNNICKSTKNIKN